ncbi:MAG: hypothetical protein KDD47_01835, partial [Acidobacteria bacterium]|nr:hypothetical protein [Acidobacteriota bacterium]
MPLLDRPLVLAVALAYLVGVLGIGFWAARRTRTARDFFIAGQSLGLWVTGLATMSAAFSGFVFLGGPGLTYRLGLSSLFVVVPVRFTAGLLCWTAGRRLRLLAQVRETFTVPDALLARFGSRRVSGLAALAILAGTVAYLGAQLQALGLLFEAIFGTREVFGEASLAVAMGLGTVILLLYATAGGMVAGVYTDVVQGLMMILAAGGVFFFALDTGGGLEQIGRSIAASDRFGPDFLDPLAGVPLVTAVGFFFVFGVGVLGQPQMLHKFFMLKDVSKLRFMPAVLAGGQSACLLIWLGLGLAVPGLVASGRLAPLEDPDQASIAFLLQFTPELLTGFVLAGILAAVMSTADSFVNIGAAALVRDLPRAFGREPGEGGDPLLRGRLAVLGVAVASAFFAYLYGDLIALLGTFAFGTFGAALAPTVAVGLNWKRVTPAAATASVATGLLASLTLDFLARQTLLPALPKAPLPAGVLPAAVAMAASFAVLFAVTILTRPV